jgi:hypothetical protein
MGMRFERILWPELSKLTGNGALRIVIGGLFLAISRGLFDAGDWAFGAFWLIFLVPIPIFRKWPRAETAFFFPPLFKHRGFRGRSRLVGAPVRSPIRGLECAAAVALSPTPGDYHPWAARAGALSVELGDGRRLPLEGAVELRGTVQVQDDVVEWPGGERHEVAVGELAIFDGDEVEVEGMLESRQVAVNYREMRAMDVISGQPIVITKVP